MDTCGAITWKIRLKKVENSRWAAHSVQNACCPFEVSFTEGCVTFAPGSSWDVGFFARFHCHSRVTTDDFRRKSLVVCAHKDRKTMCLKADRDLFSSPTKATRFLFHLFLAATGLFVCSRCWLDDCVVAKFDTYKTCQKGRTNERSENCLFLSCLSRLKVFSTD